MHSSGEVLSRVLSTVLFTRKELNYFSLFRRAEKKLRGNMRAAQNVHYYEDRHKGEDSYSAGQPWIMNKCTKKNRTSCRLEVSRDSLASGAGRFCNHVGRTKPRLLLGGSWISL